MNLLLFHPVLLEIKETISELLPALEYYYLCYLVFMYLLRQDANVYEILTHFTGIVTDIYMLLLHLFIYRSYTK